MKEEFLDLHVKLKDTVYADFTLFCRQQGMSRTKVIETMIHLVTENDMLSRNLVKELLRYNKKLYRDMERLAVETSSTTERVVENILEMYVNGELVPK